MEDVYYILERIFELTRIPVRYIDRINGVTLFLKGYESAHDPLLCDINLNRVIMEKLTAGTPPIIEFEDSIFMYGACQNDLDCCIILGPVCQVKADKEHLSKYAEKHALDSNQLYIKQRSFTVLHAAMAMIYYALTGKHVTEAETTKRTESQSESVMIQEDEFRFYMLDNAENETPQGNFADEQDFTRLIREGDVQGVLDTLGVDSFETVEQRTGTFAQKSYKQYEYLSCIVITLSTRSSIEGGLEPATAYAIGDLSFQRLERCTSIADMMEVQANTVKRFAEQVKKVMEERSRSSYIEECKHYIMKRLNKRFSLDDIAREIGINKSYLSRRFSEVEGIGIKKYTQARRVEAAANMLKYSDESISTIANYLCFPSQSQFGIIFKAHLGITPQKYRDKEKIIR